MIYGFAKQSGGQVLIDSREDAGTNVRIYLPQHSGKLMQRHGKTGWQTYCRRHPMRRS